MRSARLCMVPSGDTPTSRRLYDALAAGCVPVVMRQEQVLVLNGPPFLATGYSKSASHSLPFPRTVNWPDVVVAYSPQYGRGQSPRDAETERNVLRGMDLNKTVWQICRSEKQGGKNESASCRNRRGGMKVTREAYTNATSKGTEKCRQLEAEWLESRASANWSHQLGQRAHDAYCAHLDVEGNPLGVADAFLREVLVKAIFLEENAERREGAEERQAERQKAQTKAQKKAQKKAKKRAQAQKKAPKTLPDSRNGQTVRVFSLVLFGFELQMLRLHLLQTAPHLHAVLVAESTITFQGGPKPAHLTEALARETVPMARKLRVAVVSPEELRQHCGALMQQGGYSAARCVETHQRARLFRMLFEVAAANDVALLCDVDEIAKPQTLQRLRRAPPFGPNGSAPHKVVLEAIDYKFGVHCAMRAPWTGLHAYSVAFLLRNSQNLRFLAEQGKNQIWKQPRWSAAAWHLSSFGTRAQLRQSWPPGATPISLTSTHTQDLCPRRVLRAAQNTVLCRTLRP